MKQEEEEAAAAAMLNPDKAPEVKMFTKWKQYFLFFSSKSENLCEKNLHKGKIFVFSSISENLCEKSTQSKIYLFDFLFKKWKWCVVDKLKVVTDIDKKWKWSSTKKIYLTEIILKVKKPDAPVDPAGQGNKSKEQVSGSSMIDQRSLPRPYLFDLF